MDLTGLYVTALDQITGQVAMAVAAAAIMGHDALTTIDAQSKLQDRLNNLGDCARIFGGAKASDLAALASKVNFYDGRPDAAGAQRSLNAVSGNGDQTSLADYTQYTVARTIVGNDGPLSKVVLGRDYFGDPTISQPDTLLHEFLHIAIGVDDPGLKAYLVS